MNKIITTAMALAIPMGATASEMTTLEGKVVFDKGQYHIDGVNLTGLNLSELRQYEGQVVKIAGEKTHEHLNIYKVFMKTENGYETSYDWDVVNSETYED